MKLTIESGKLELWSLLPVPAVIYDPHIKTFEVGIYFLKFYFTIKIKVK